MSLHDYRRSLKLLNESFYSLLLASLQRSDTTNFERLKRAFPEVAQELQDRHRSPDGRTPSEMDLDEFEQPRRLGRSE